MWFDLWRVAAIALLVGFIHARHWAVIRHSALMRLLSGAGIGYFYIMLADVLTSDKELKHLYWVVGVPIHFVAMLFFTNDKWPQHLKSALGRVKRALLEKIGR